ncbi:hypothetical protein VNO77_33152 [Canavalia gladiata]|uniref:GTP-eEF1A C-terminal domain-containing protein n=1 Tax=Canavalia gladiata TaxID=3824 RepID=A0AAN9KBV1_CANGL
MGKVESGTDQVKIVAIFIDENRVNCAGPGENLQIRMSGVEEDILIGFVLSSIANPIATVTEFVVQLAILELLDNVSNYICIEKFFDFPQLGRFTVRTEGKTVAVGKVTVL